MQNVVLGIQRRAPWVQPRERRSRCEVKTRGELIHNTWPKQRATSMGLRQSCMLLQTTAFGIWTRDMTAALLRRRYHSGFAGNARVAADRGKSRNVGTPVVTASLSDQIICARRRAQGKLRATCETNSPSVNLPYAWTSLQISSVPRAQNVDTSHI